MNAKSLLAAIEADKEAHISFLQSFVQAPSPNPPGDTTAAAEVITSYLTSRSITPEIIAPQANMPNVVSTFTCGNASGPRLILNGHIDVFPVETDTSNWSHPPWSGFIDHSTNHLHGRGTVDMKAGTAALVIAYAYLPRYRSYLSGSLGLTAVADEETGGKWGSRYLLDDPRWRGDCMINAEPSGLGTIRFGEKGTLRVTFTVKTEGAHGAHMHRSEGAARVAARCICELVEKVEGIVPIQDPALEAYMRREDVRDAVGATMGEGAKDIMLKATVNIGTIHGGLKVNMIPDTCVFEADIRLPLGLTKEQVLDVIQKMLGTYPEVTLNVQEAASNAASSCSHNHPMVGMLARHAEAVTGKKPLAIPSLGASDCKFWRYKDVPAYDFGVSPEGMASTNESISIDEFLAVLKKHALAAWEYLGGPI